MKYLTHYIEPKVEVLMQNMGAFYAFNTNQFERQRKEGVKYVSLGSGTIVPKDNAKELVDGMERVVKEGIEADKADHTMEQIIIRELYNHEAFYTASITDTVNKLKDYGYTKEQINQVFLKEAARKEEADRRSDMEPVSPSLSGGHE